MTQLTVTEFRALLRTIWPLEGGHLIEPEQALLKLSHWGHRDFYRDASPFWAACNAARLFTCSPVAGARRYAFYELNERGKQFHARLGTLLAGRMLARHIAHQRNGERARRTEVLRTMQEDAEMQADYGAARDAQRYAGVL